jgi:type IV secretory pathway VirB3-like protein
MKFKIEVHNEVYESYQNISAKFIVIYLFVVYYLIATYKQKMIPTKTTECFHSSKT